MIPEIALYASMEPRPFERGNYSMPRRLKCPCLMLQWSHVLSNVETKQPRRAPWLSVGFNGATSFRTWKRVPLPNLTSVALASMEPRPFERGNEAKGNYETLKNEVLQWSHVLSNVETSAVVVSRNILDLLQWSHVLSNVETSLHGQWYNPARRASMEPRPFERGNTVAAG